MAQTAIVAFPAKLRTGTSFLYLCVPHFHEGRHLR